MARLISEVVEQRLILAFDGRPFEVQMLMSFGRRLIVSHENGRHHVELNFSSTDETLLLRDSEAFKKRIVDPCLQALDRVAYPEREKRKMEAVKRLPQLLLEPGELIHG